MLIANKVRQNNPIRSIRSIKNKKIYKIENIVCKYAVTSQKPQGTSKTNSNNKKSNYKIHINSLYIHKI